MIVEIAIQMNQELLGGKRGNEWIFRERACICVSENRGERELRVRLAMAILPVFRIDAVGSKWQRNTC